jgi:hypothetical protein
MMGANYGRRKDDDNIGISMIPKWMNIIMIICKWFISTIPFVICSFLMFFQSEMSLWNNMLLTCVYLLSLSSIINSLDN